MSCGPLPVAYECEKCGNRVAAHLVTLSAQGKGARVIVSPARVVCAADGFDMRAVYSEREEADARTS